MQRLVFNLAGFCWRIIVARSNALDCKRCTPARARRRLARKGHPLIITSVRLSGAIHRQVDAGADGNVSSVPLCFELIVAFLAAIVVLFVHTNRLDGLRGQRLGAQRAHQRWEIGGTHAWVVQPDAHHVALLAFCAGHAVLPGHALQGHLEGLAVGVRRVHDLERTHGGRVEAVLQSSLLGDAVAFHQCPNDLLLAAADACRQLQELADGLLVHAARVDTKNGACHVHLAAGWLDDDAGLVDLHDSV
mmetsp:Transcript_8448/g.25572  ORF Transcript_8448/g.25572 Transcript_8448/m.25572 type:complete len:247 (+) Transcript_8448:2997-3737(+)